MSNSVRWLSAGEDEYTPHGKKCQGEFQKKRRKSDFFFTIHNSQFLILNSGESVCVPGGAWCSALRRRAEPRKDVAGDVPTIKLN